MSLTFQDAVALHQQGCLDQAAEAYREVLRQGEHFGAAYNLSLLDASRGRYVQALPPAMEAVRLAPQSAEARDHLGCVLLGLGESARAVPQFQAALAIEPNFARACSNLGAALQELSRVEESIPWLERALELRPDYVDARWNLATALERLNRYDEAQHHAAKALAASAESAPSHGKFGVIARVRGQLQEAEDAFRRGLERDDQNAKLYLLLAGSRCLSLDDPAIGGMNRLLARVETLDPDEQIALHFALGKVYADNKRFDLALDHLKTANALKRPLVDYNEEATLDALNRIASSFGRDAMKSFIGNGNPSEKPIFIVGMPRSGSTLVEQILASHPRVFGAGELPAFDRAVIETFTGTAPLTPELLRHLGAGYVREVEGLAPSAARITDKMLSNFRYIGLIHLALPNARIIHTRRNPLDTCVSCFAQHFADDQPFAFDLAELGRYYRAYDRLMEHWRGALPENAMLEVQYEELIDDFETQARRLVEYAGLEWDPACLQFHTTQRSVVTASVAQVRRPIYRTSVGRWGAHADALRPLLAALTS